MAQKILFDCVHWIGLAFIVGCHEAVISTVLLPFMIFAGELLVMSTGWPGIK